MTKPNTNGFTSLQNVSSLEGPKFSDLNLPDAELIEYGGISVAIILALSILMWSIAGVLKAAQGKE